MFRLLNFCWFSVECFWWMWFLFQLARLCWFALQFPSLCSVSQVWFVTFNSPIHIPCWIWITGRHDKLLNSLSRDVTFIMQVGIFFPQMGFFFSAYNNSLICSLRKPHLTFSKAFSLEVHMIVNFVQWLLHFFPCYCNDKWPSIVLIVLCKDFQFKCLYVLSFIPERNHVGGNSSLMSG